MVRTHIAAVEYALRDELYWDDEELFVDWDHRKDYFSMDKFYLGSVKRGSGTVHYWWVSADEEIMTIDVGPKGIIVTGNLRSPLENIPVQEVSLQELVEREWRMPPILSRSIAKDSDAGASVIRIYQYRACDLLFPLMGIRVITSVSLESIKYEHEDGVVLFYT
ncbi:MAG: hypothetical protein ACXAAO_01235 [Candidatus Thorarchaeota archaeon]|jgi:hypothetical protein